MSKIQNILCLGSFCEIQKTFFVALVATYCSKLIVACSHTKILIMPLRGGQPSNIYNALSSELSIPIQGAFFLLHSKERTWPLRSKMLCRCVLSFYLGALKPVIGLFLFAYHYFFYTWFKLAILMSVSSVTTDTDIAFHSPVPLSFSGEGDA